MTSANLYLSDRDPDHLPAELDLLRTSELIFDRFEQMEFAFAEAHQSAQGLVQTMEETIRNLNALHQDLSKPDQSDLEERLDHLTRRLGPAETLETTLVDIRTALDNLAGQIGTEGTDPGGAKEQAFEANLAEAISGLARQETLDMALADLRSMASGEPADAALLSKMLLKLEDFGGRLNTLSNKGAAAAQRVEAALSATPGLIETAIADLEARFQKRLEEIAPPTGIPDTQTPKEETDTSPDHLSAVMTRLDGIEAALSATHGTGTPDGDFELRLSQVIAESVEQTVSRLSRRLDDSLAEQTARLSTGLETLGGLEKKVDALRSRPDPVLDLTPQRRSLGQFGLAISTAVTRIETLAKQVEDRLDAPQTPVAPDQTVISAILRGVDRKLTEQGDRRAEREEGLREDLAVAMDKIATLELKIDALRSRPDPVIDLAPQRQSFGQFAVALNRIVSRVEEMSDQVQAALVEKPPSQGDDRLPSLLAAISARLERRLGGFTAGLAETWRNDLAALGPALDRIPELEQKVDLLRSRPDPVLDLGPQRLSLAQFGAVLTDRLNRLETLADGLNELVAVPRAEDGNTAISPVSAQETPSDLAEANRVLATHQAVALHDLVRQQERFLQDVRSAVAECLAQTLSHVNANAESAPEIDNISICLR